MSASDDEWETTEVLICGCGPTGAMLSGYLGKMGVSNIVLEKEPAITTDPRGIALDDDGIRLMQGLGLYKDIFTTIGSCKTASASTFVINSTEDLLV
jgi:2-polyprenyl-6-methoxyphenol hydroxylase-like FAD-dependent oxidoreductase